MTPLRLHGTCPACASVEPLRPDGTMVQHTRPRGDYWRTGRCEGTGAAPVAGSVAAWLDAQDAEARAGVDRAQRAVSEAADALDRARAHANAVTKATAKARARLARKAGE
mgnify:FL=1